MSIPSISFEVEVASKADTDSDDLLHIYNMHVSGLMVIALALFM
jgi:hypothetical protein